MAAPVKGIESIGMLVVADAADGVVLFACNVGAGCVDNDACRTIDEHGCDVDALLVLQQRVCRSGRWL